MVDMLGLTDEQLDAIPVAWLGQGKGAVKTRPTPYKIEMQKALPGKGYRVVTAWYDASGDIRRVDAVVKDGEDWQWHLGIALETDYENLMEAREQNPRF